MRRQWISSFFFCPPAALDDWPRATQMHTKVNKKSKSDQFTFLSKLQCKCMIMHFLVQIIISSKWRSFVGETKQASFVDDDEKPKRAKIAASQEGVSSRRHVVVEGSRHRCILCEWTLCVSGLNLYKEFSFCLLAAFRGVVGGQEAVMWKEESVFLEQPNVEEILFGRPSVSFFGRL